MTPNISVYVVGEVDPEGGQYIIGIYQSQEAANTAAEAHKKSENYDGGKITTEVYAVKPNAMQPPPNNPHAVARRLDAIKALRHEHTRQFMQEDWASMQRVTSRIVKAWADYEFSCRCAFEKRVCFNCCAEPREEFTVEAPGKSPMLFCSAECRMEFGVSLGLT